MGKGNRKESSKKEKVYSPGKEEAYIGKKPWVTKENQEARTRGKKK